MSHFTVLVIADVKDLKICPKDLNPRVATEIAERELEPFWELDLPADEARHNKYAEFEPRMGKFEALAKCKADLKRRKAEALFQGKGNDKFLDRMITLNEGCKANIIEEKEMVDFWVENYYGYSYNNDYYGYWYNPNAKWDWFSVGGRWRGLFKVKEGVKKVLGNAGLYGDKPIKEDGTDIAFKKEIAIEEMREEAIIKAKEAWPRYLEFKEDNKKYDEKRKTLSEEERCKIRIRDEIRHFGEFGVYCHKELKSVEELENEYKIATYAVIKDGKWYQKGEMGWWGMSSDEMSEEEWIKKWNELVDEADEDDLFILCDCHI